MALSKVMRGSDGAVEPIVMVDLAAFLFDLFGDVVRGADVECWGGLCGGWG